MREIKFRGKTLGDELFFGDLIQSNGEPKRYKTTGKLKESFVLVRDDVTLKQAEKFIEDFNNRGVLKEGWKAKFIGLYNSDEE